MTRLPFGATEHGQMLKDQYAHSPLTLLHVAAELRKCGVPPVDLFRQAGIAPAQMIDAQRWIPRALCFRLADTAADVTGDPYFASRIGNSYELAEFGIWGRTIETAETVRDACVVAGRGVGLIHDGTDLQLVLNGREAQLRFGYRGLLGADPRQHVIGSLAVLRKIVLLGNAPDGIEVHFSVPYSRGADRLEGTHGSRLRFGCDYNAICFDRDILDLPVAGAPGSAAAGGNEPVEPQKTVEDVSALLRDLLPFGRADINTVAGHLNVSKRTLQRRLTEWGFAFEEILDDVRRTDALAMVRDGAQPATEIAFILGYSDPAHFTRAFRRWTGVSPSAYRRTSNAV